MFTIGVAPPAATSLVGLAPRSRLGDGGAAFATLTAGGAADTPGPTVSFSPSRSLSRRGLRSPGVGFTPAPLNAASKWREPTPITGRLRGGAFAAGAGPVCEGTGGTTTEGGAVEEGAVETGAAATLAGPETIFVDGTALALAGLGDFGAPLEGPGTLRDLAAFEEPWGFCGGGAAVKAEAAPFLLAFFPTEAGSGALGAGAAFFLGSSLRFAARMIGSLWWA